MVSEAPTLRALFGCFLRIGVQSFGGGLSVWIRRETVERRRWLDDPAFLAGYALSQITPGPNAVNLTVFVGTVLRGRAGAAIALAGLLGLPVAIVLALGYGYLATRGSAASGWIATGLEGMGAAAIGMNLSLGVRLTPRTVRQGAGATLVMAATALSIGVLGLPLILVLAVAIPLSLLSSRRA